MDYTTIKVLLIEDNPGDARLLREYLAEVETVEFDLTHVGRLSEGLEYLRKVFFDVVLLDLSLPDSQGLDTFIKVHTQGHRIPIVVMTGFDDETFAVQAMQEGAQDYLVKGQVDSGILARSIRYAIERNRMLIALSQHSDELRAREENFRNLITRNVDAMVIVDMEGAVRFVNPAAETLFGSKSEQLVGTSFGFRLLVTEATEVDIIGSDGHHHVAEMRAVDTHWEGEPVYLAVLRDITERKQAEEKLRAFTAKLERSNRELEDFAYVASHDLQEPLRKIQAFGDRLKAKCGAAFTDQGRDYLGRMQNAARRMQILINDLLTFSRVTTKAHPFQTVDLNQIVQEVLSDLEVHIEQTAAQVEVDALPSIEVDQLQMRQLLQNLLSNALKFQRRGVPPVIKIQSKMLNHHDDWSDRSAPANGFCQITVEDNGIGFDEKYLDRIFTIFQRLHGRSEYEGTGVGLAVCRKIVERHGGEITAKSKLGEGATFIVILPVKQLNGGSERI